MQESIPIKLPTSITGATTTRLDGPRSPRRSAVPARDLSPAARPYLTRRSTAVPRRASY
ncbi:hypothetical protein [Nonomuraea typhae]|uniref:hypothetical protein n=1 Tax=Nonomuraea typhae TaxID=2603600 RepID=UPI0012F8668B|nr:hypothetical protein [Nonomuraea typhae]